MVAPSAVTTMAPRAPKVAITARAPRARSFWHASAIVRWALEARSLAPVAWASSISFSTATSTHFSRPAGKGRKGARFSTVCAPAARACLKISFVTSRGVSNCATQTSPCAGAQCTMVLVKCRLAPEATVMALSPSATWISARPDARPSMTCRPSVSTSLSARKLRSECPNGSSPTAPIIDVEVPSRPDAIAWFSPLPPGRKATSAPSSVSPATGRRLLCTTTSILRLPQTTTLLIAACSLHPGRQRQVLLAQESRVEQLGLVAAAAVGEDRDDGLAGAELLGELHRAHDVDGGRTAQHQAFVLDEVEQQRQGFLVGNAQRQVDRRALEVLGDASLSDALGDRVALGFQFALGVPAVERRPHRIA